MRKCPQCSQWSLDFDEYFGRFRCFNANCMWMQTAAVERRLRLLQAKEHPVQLGSYTIPELQLTVSAAYDKVNDALVFDFGSSEPSFEFPDNDVRILWSIGRQTGRILGFVVLNAKAFGISAVEMDIAARMDSLDSGMRRNPVALEQGRPTRLSVENIAVTLRTESHTALSKEGLAALSEAVRKLTSNCLSA